MSLEGKNRKVFSYNNEDRRGSNFMYKDFEKCNSYHTNFCDITPSPRKLFYPIVFYAIKCYN